MHFHWSQRLRGEPRFTEFACCRVLGALALASVATAALAGPPYLNNDPAPTNTGRWEIYLFSNGEGHGSDVDVDSGVEFNYGPVEDVQVSATLPLSFSHSAGGGWDSGTGRVESGSNPTSKTIAAASWPHSFPRRCFPRRASLITRRQGFSCRFHWARISTEAPACSEAAATM